MNQVAKVFVIGLVAAAMGAGSAWAGPDRGKPDSARRGEFSRTSMFQMDNLIQVEVRPSGKASYLFNSWGARGEEVAPCAELIVKTPKGDLEIDDCKRGQWTLTVNGRVMQLSPEHHLLVTKSGEVKIVSGERPLDDASLIKPQ